MHPIFGRSAARKAADSPKGLEVRRSGRLLWIVAAILVVGLSYWRVSLPSARTSPEALESFNRKISQIVQDNAIGKKEKLAFSGVELNSALEDWYRNEHPDDGWPFRGTAFHFRASRAHIFMPLYTLAGFRIILVDMSVDARWSVLYQRPQVLWIGVVPVPCEPFAWVAKTLGHRPPPEFWRSWRVTYPVREIRIVGDELIVETR